MSHGEHAPIAFRAFSHLPQTIQHAYFVYDKQVVHPLCVVLREARISVLKRYLPNVTIQLSAGEVWQDFVKLVFAPNVFIMGGGSTFALWSTIANGGNVWAPPLFNGETPYFGLTYRWLHEPLLSIGRASELNQQINRTSAILEWLQTH